VKEPSAFLIASARRRMKRCRAGPGSLPWAYPASSFWVLVNIDEAEGPSLGEIAARLRLDAPTARVR